MTEHRAPLFENGQAPVGSPPLNYTISTGIDHHMSKERYLVSDHTFLRSADHQTPTQNVDSMAQN